MPDEYSPPPSHDTAFCVLYVKGYPGHQGVLHLSENVEENQKGCISSKSGEGRLLQTQVAWKQVLILYKVSLRYVTINSSGVTKLY